MKITRRDGENMGGRFIVSVPARQVERVESALTFLEDVEAESASQIVVDLILAAARRKGWKPPTREIEESPEMFSPVLAAA